MNDVHKDNSRAGLLIMVLLILMLVAVSAALTLTLYMTGQAYQERLVIGLRRFRLPRQGR